MLEDERVRDILACEIFGHAHLGGLARDAYGRRFDTICACSERRPCIFHHVILTMMAVPKTHDATTAVRCGPWTDITDDSLLKT